MDIHDSLELLSSSFTHPFVRRYAVTRLAQANDDELLLYLLQLVQALKYEDFEEIRKSIDADKAKMVTITMDGRSNQSTPDGKSASSSSPADASKYNPLEYRRPSLEGIEIAQVAETELNRDLESIVSDTEDMDLGNEMDLATFLITRCASNAKLASYFYWYLVVERGDQRKLAEGKNASNAYNLYHTMLRRFATTLSKGGSDCLQLRSQLLASRTFVDMLSDLMSKVKESGGSRPDKIKYLQKMLSAQNQDFSFEKFPELPLALDPEVKIHGVIPGEAFLFKSALTPGLFAFRTAEDDVYRVIFKYGDDLRQDQLVLQIITLMDKLLRQEHLDLKMTPYKVLAVTQKSGFVQFIDGKDFAQVEKDDRTILAYLQTVAPGENSPLGVRPDVLDNYVRSCAGYCVVTYLLGVGDRHLNNVLITKSGKIFHIDFGYILDYDPKPMPPPLLLTRSMVEAMGGVDGEPFMEFKTLCYTAFLTLRRFSNLILNLFSLMQDADIPDIAKEPNKLMTKVQDKFRLDLSDEQAVTFMHSVLETSLNSKIGTLIRLTHGWVAGVKS